MFDCIIKGGTLFDGLGSDPQTGDVAIKDGIITEVGGKLDGLAKRVIDADGAIVTPGSVSYTHLRAHET